MLLQKGSLRFDHLAGESSEHEDRIRHVRGGSIMLPLPSATKVFITVSFLEQVYRSRSLFIGPTINVPPILPSDAELFSVIELGDLDALKRLLAERKATLSTRDQDGRRLLNVCSPKPVWRSYIDFWSMLCISHTPIFADFLSRKGRRWTSLNSMVTMACSCP